VHPGNNWSPPIVHSQGLLCLLSSSSFFGSRRVYPSPSPKSARLEPRKALVQEPSFHQPLKTLLTAALTPPFHRSINWVSTFPLALLVSATLTFSLSYRLTILTLLVDDPPLPWQTRVFFRLHPSPPSAIAQPFSFLGADLPSPL